MRNSWWPLKFMYGNATWLGNVASAFVPAKRFPNPFSDGLQLRLACLLEAWISRNAQGARWHNISSIITSIAMQYRTPHPDCGTLSIGRSKLTYGKRKPN